MKNSPNHKNLLKHLPCILILTAAILAFLLANHSEGYTFFKRIIHLPIGVTIGGVGVKHSLKYWVENLLMVFFFYLIGLELKQKVCFGELHDPKLVATLALSAFSGIIVPVACFLSLVHIFHTPYPEGWAIPISTDTSVAIALIAFLRKDLPKSALSFLLGLAIFDDIYSLLVIVLFYSSGIKAEYLLYSMGCLGILSLSNHYRLRHPAIYLMIGWALWLCLSRAGLHGTAAGFLVALFTPKDPVTESQKMIKSTKHLIKKLEAVKTEEQMKRIEREHRLIKDIEHETLNSISPLKRFEHFLETPVSFIVLPLYAFTNSGVNVVKQNVMALIQHPLFMIIGFCLVCAKPMGIYLGVSICKSARWCHLPKSINPSALLIISLVSGIGFTMSLYMTNLALDRSFAKEVVKFSILVSAVISGTLSISSAKYFSNYQRCRDLSYS